LRLTQAGARATGGALLRLDDLERFLGSGGLTGLRKLGRLDLGATVIHRVIPRETCREVEGGSPQLEETG